MFCFYQHCRSRCHTPCGTNMGRISCWHQPSHCTNTVWKPASPRVTHEAWLLEFQSSKTEPPKTNQTKKPQQNNFAMQPTPVSSVSQDTTPRSLRRPALHHQTDLPRGEAGTSPGFALSRVSAPVPVAACRVLLEWQEGLTTREQRRSRHLSSEADVV